MQSLRVLCEVGTGSSYLKSRVRALKSGRAKAQAISRRRLRPGISHIAINVGFVENVTARGQVYLRILHFSAFQ